MVLLVVMVRWEHRRLRPLLQLSRPPSAVLLRQAQLQLLRALVMLMVNLLDRRHGQCHCQTFAACGLQQSARKRSCVPAMARRLLALSVAALVLPAAMVHRQLRRVQLLQLRWIEVQSLALVPPLLPHHPLQTCMRCRRR